MTKNRDKEKLSKEPVELADEDITAVSGGALEPEHSPGNCENPGGTTSTVITVDERQWLRESGDDSQTWYGLDNPRY